MSLSSRANTMANDPKSKEQILHGLVRDRGKIIGHGRPDWTPDDTGTLQGLSLSHVVWPPDPWGYSHARATWELADLIACDLGLAGKDVSTVHFAALYHELGRAGTIADGREHIDAEDRKQRAQGEPSEGATTAAVEAAMRYARDLPYSGPEFKEEVVRLVLALRSKCALTGSRPFLDGDKRLVALHDAELLEEARFVKARGWGHWISVVGRLVSPWAQVQQRQVKWLARYGIG